MQRLKMLTTGPNRNRRKGQVVEVDDQRAEILLAGKHAVDLNAKETEEDQPLLSVETERN